MSLRSILLVGAVVATILFGSWGLSQDLRDEVLTGGELTAAQAATLEERLAQNPQDVTSRAQLPGYYFLERRAEPTGTPSTSSGSYATRRSRRCWRGRRGTSLP